MSELDWGSVPSYFGAAALLFTAATIWRDRRYREREQAQKVAAWVSVDAGATKLTVRNASDLPITNLEAAWPSGPSSERVLYGKRAQIGPNYSDDIDYTPQVLQTDFAPEIRFTDCAGRDWLRDAKGRLRRRHRTPVPAPR